MSDETPIAWLALASGTPIYSADNEEIGKVDEVVADRQKDIFSGVTFKTGLLSSALFVPAERIASMTEDAVRTTIPAAEKDSLEPYET
ncbi:MAG TPA: PRC-barrel domain-containing protein [Actinomycetota bacterium]|nr:PRC-barrel domain-containing protein [Actinomycetota bacterium]